MTTAGYPDDLASVNNRIGTVAMQLRNAMEAVEDLNTFLQYYGSAGLTGTATGMTSQAAAVVMSANTDMYKLSQVYRGAATVPTAYDFTTFTKQLTGPN